MCLSPIPRVGSPAVGDLPYWAHQQARSRNTIGSRNAIVRSTPSCVFGIRRPWLPVYRACARAVKGSAEQQAVHCIHRYRQQRHELDVAIPAGLASRVRAVCDVNRECVGYWNGTIRGPEPARLLVKEHHKDNSCLAYADFRELVARGDVDAIYIGTPDHWHALIAIAAAPAGKDIFGQKPLALTVREGRAMVEAVSKADIVWQTGSQQGSDSNFRIVCELVRNHRLGELHTVRVGLPSGRPNYGKTAHLTEPQPVPEGFDYDYWLGPAPEKPYAPVRVGVNFRWVSGYSGGQVTDWGAHHLDIAQWWLGMDNSGPVAIHAPEGKFERRPIYDTATESFFECEYANGVRLICSDKERPGVRFEGKDGWAWANRGTHEASAKGLLTAPLGRSEVRLYRNEDHVKNFVDSCFSRTPTVASIEAAHRSVTITHLGNIAILKRRGFRWNPKKERIIGNKAANSMLERPCRTPSNRS